MATGKRAGPGIKNRNVAANCGLRPFKLDLNYASEAAFLAAKGAKYNSSTAEAGDFFFHTGENALWVYNGTGWERNVDGAERFVTFKDEPASVKKAGAGAATGTAGDENLMRVGGSMFEYHIVGTQTIVSPALGSAGLDIGMDQTDNDGVELTRGITSASSLAFTVGTSPAFYLKVKASIADVSGTDAFMVGFRKAEAYQADPDSYDEMASLLVNAGNIFGAQILNNAATDEDDTTDNWADGETHTLEVYVSAAGVVTYKIDGADPTTAPASFTFDAAEVVVPFVYLRHDADVAGAVEIVSFDCGLQ